MRLACWGVLAAAWGMFRDAGGVTVPATDVTLTVAQSKRLIARAIPRLGEVHRALSSGLVIVCKGSTTAYVAEELIGRSIRKDAFILGRTLPHGFQAPEGLWGSDMAEVVLRKGRVVEGASLAEAIGELGPGDVVIKGANALDYRAGLVAHLIGHPAGGTMGTILGPIHGKGAHLVVPVGLEKLVAHDLTIIARRLAHTRSDTTVPRIWITGGLIVTEIEALRLLAGVEAVHIASGGICGAEGAVRLRLLGTNDQIDKALALISEVHAEPPYLDACLAAREEE